MKLEAVTWVTLIYQLGGQINIWLPLGLVSKFMVGCQSPR